MNNQENLMKSVTIQVTPSEYTILARSAEENHLSISDNIHSVLFKESDAQLNQQLPLLLFKNKITNIITNPHLKQKEKLDFIKEAINHDYC